MTVVHRVNKMSKEEEIPEIQVIPCDPEVEEKAVEIVEEVALGRISPQSAVSKIKREDVRKRVANLLKVYDVDPEDVKRARQATILKLLLDENPDVSSKGVVLSQREDALSGNASARSQLRERLKRAKTRVEKHLNEGSEEVTS